MSDYVKVLRDYNIWRRGEREDMKMPAPGVIGQSIDAAIEEITRLRKIERAARNLTAVKGRHNSEIAYTRLVEAMK